MRLTMLFVLTCAATALPAQSASAATYRVGSGASCTHSTIQAAIDDAVASAADDEIRISGNWTGQALSINAAEGAITLVGGYPGCTFTTPVAGARSVLTGNNAQPVLRINASSRVSLRNLDIQGGRSSDNGGGIRYTTNAAALLAIEDSYVRNNNADVAGGGLSIVNDNVQLAPDQVRVDIRGDSNVLGNAALVAGGMGGGIHCIRASVNISGSTHVSQNRARTFGGGIYAGDCKVAIGSRGVAGAVLWANEVEDVGGGAHATGGLASIEIYTIDALQPARVVGNRAYVGAAVSGNGGAVVRLFDVNVEQNIGNMAAVWINSFASPGAVSTSFLMQGGVDGAPAGAAACADPESCNRFVGNGADGNGAALWISANWKDQVPALATLRGTRIEGNTGRWTIYVQEAVLDLDGALVVRNTASSALVNSAAGRIAVTASTIAGNDIGPAQRIIYAPGSCGGPLSGTRIERSIVWQPGHALAGFDTDFPVQPECFRHVIAADFTALAPSPERVVADPQFVDPAAGDYRLAPGSPALDFAPAHAGDATRDRGRRVVDLADAPDRFGSQDLGAYERSTDTIFRSGFD